MTETEWLATSDSPVLVVVVNDPADLARAREHGWYRIPLRSAPSRIAAEYLAFYLTGAFPEGERWSVRWFAAVRDYRIVSRRELIPEEPNHPRAADRYYRVGLGPLLLLTTPIPSRRLRRITFIPTTFERLHSAREINDLWIKTPAQERLWSALKQADLDAECQYELADDWPGSVADLALFCAEGRIAVIVEDEPRTGDSLREEAALEYRLAAGDWCALHLTHAQLAGNLEAWLDDLIVLVRARGGIA